jgi:RNA polymerase sigma factor (sigma-70 family)
MTRDFNYYYKKEKKGVMQKLRRFSAEDAEDICQEVFTRAFQYFDRFDSNKAPFGAWLSGIVSNCVRAFDKERILRGQVITQNIPDIPEFLEPHYEDNTVEAQEHIDGVMDKIAEKSHPYKDVLYLSHVMGHSPNQISKRLGIKYRTVTQSLFRFKKEIKKNAKR